MWKMETAVIKGLGLLVAVMDVLTKQTDHIKRQIHSRLYWPLCRICLQMTMKSTLMSLLMRMKKKVL